MTKIKYRVSLSDFHPFLFTFCYIRGLHYSLNGQGICVFLRLTPHSLFCLNLLNKALPDHTNLRVTPSLTQLAPIILPCLALLTALITTCHLGVVYFFVVFLSTRTQTSTHTPPTA